MRKTKIVATLGPAISEVGILTRLIEAGADVLRVNFSHARPDEHARLIETTRQASEQAGREVAVLGDLPGPKLRIGELPDNRVELREGDEVTIAMTEGPVEDGVIPMPWKGLPSVVSAGDEIFLADGLIRLRARSVQESRIVCSVEHGGILTSHQGMNLPGATTGLPAAGESDLAWSDFSVEHGVDLLALSFVRRAEDLNPVIERLESRGADIPVIPKLEKPEALDNAEEIIKAAVGGVMIARGDLGIELPLERIPGVQKRLIALAGHWSVPTITATQMLASMVAEPRPTRAEVTDVANAIRDGTDAVMLSEETAIGDYPLETVRIMARIAEETERDLPYGEWSVSRAGVEEAGAVAGVVAFAAVTAAERIGLSALVVPTESGRTARIVSARHSRVPVLALSPSLGTVRRVQALFGVQARRTHEHRDMQELFDQCAVEARESGVAESGDLIGVTAGLPEQELGTNLFEVHRVP